MKRKIAVLLCLLLGAMTFWGCSSAELDYLNLSKEMSNIKSCEMSGDMEVYYDAEAIKDFILENVDSTVYTKEEMREQFKGLAGKNKIGISYSGSMEMSAESMEFYLDLSATIDGKSRPLGDMYVSFSDGIYFERDLLLNIYLLSEEMLTGYEDSYFYSDKYEKDFREALGTAEYIEIVSGADMQEQLGGTDFTAEMFAATEDSSTAIIDAAIKFLTDAFKGYTTGSVSTIPGGFKISITGDAVTTIISDCMDYLAKNIDVVMDSFTEYMVSVYELMSEAYPEEAVDAEEFRKQLTLDNQEKLEAARVIASLKGQFDYLVKTGNVDWIKGFSLNETVKKSGDSYIGESVLSLDDGGKNIAYLKSSSKVSPNRKNLEVPKRGTPMMTVVENINNLEETYNPINSAEITWSKTRQYDDYSGTCDILYKRSSESPLTDGDLYDWSEYKNINKSMYMPLRTLCEAFGEELGWDNKTKTAYILKDGAKISVDGVLDSKTTYIKVTELEKLGYKVTYNGSDQDYHKIVIQK